MDPDKHKFEVVWTTLPVISALVPTIGHVGVSSSDGTIHDFSAPYTVTTGRFMCGPPKRVVRLDASRVGVLSGVSDEGKVAAFDAAVARAARTYEGRNHNLFLDNCHSHVALTLNEMRYDGRDDWTMFGVYRMLLTQGTWVSRAAAVRALAPTVVIVFLVVGTVALGATLGR